MIGIIDYKAGNAPSVLNAYKKLEIDAKLVLNNDDLLICDKIILPGVGSAKETINSLAELSITDTLYELVIKKQVPFLGICIGLQVLFEESEEENVKCLGFLKGKVLKFDATKVRVPQMGWNEVNFTKENPILKDIGKKDYFYFVNSYYVKPQDKDIILGTTNYGIDFCSMISYKNIFATQFHTEKSGEAGLTILKNFAYIQGGALC